MLVRGWHLFDTWRVLEEIHYLNKGVLNSQYMWHVDLVAWNDDWSVALNALTLNTFYLSYQRSTTIRLELKSQNISENSRILRSTNTKWLWKKSKKNNLLEAFGKKWIVKQTICMKHGKEFSLLVIQNISLPPNGTMSLNRTIHLWNY